jgi:hypothetical protein
MRRTSPRPFVLVLMASLAAGCGIATAGTSAVNGTASGGAMTSAARSPAGASRSAAAPGQPPFSPARQRATADAQAILGQFVPPPGAVRLAGKPQLPSGSATMGLNATTQADAAGYWRASGSATALQAWERAHISRSFSRQDVIVGPPDWNTVYSLPAVAGLLPQRELNVQFYDVGGGATVIMAEAMVAWQPPRPATEVIPATVTTVTVAAAGPWLGHPAPVTLTSATVARRLAALLNQLPVSTVGQVPCPSGPGGFELTFRAAAGGPETAFARPGACGSLSVRIDGTDRPALQPSSSYVASVLKITGLDWKPVP